MRCRVEQLIITTCIVVVFILRPRLMTIRPTALVTSFYLYFSHKNNKIRRPLLKPIESQGNGFIASSLSEYFCKAQMSFNIASSNTHRIVYCW
jgi:hypothetical protein